MNSQRNMYKEVLALIALCFSLVSCQDTLPTRATVANSATTPTTTCAAGETLDTTTNTCKTTKVTRPTGAINFKADYCVCKDGVAVSYGNCSSVCTAKGSTSGVEQLFANFTVTEAISLSGFGNVGAWCNTALSTDTAQPSCVIQAKDDDGNTLALKATAAVGFNSVTADLSSLSYDKTYVLTLVEQSSGSKSDSVQVIKFSSSTGPESLGPLKQQLVNQYTCMVRNYSTLSTSNTTSTVYYDSAYRLHFYYIPRYAPEALATTSNIFCHDVFTYGNKDSTEYPRLELIEGVFNLWDATDPRFYDNNSNNIKDVNDVIFDKTKAFGGSIPSGTNFFAAFKWPGSPTLSSSAGNTNSTDTTAKEIGYYMAPWINTTTYKSYCPSNTEYNGSNPLFQALRDVLQVETEGIYIGEKAAETITTTTNGTTTTTTGSKDYILIRETDLKQVWFYFKNGTPTAPTDSNVANVTVYFYYPLNKTTPFVKSSTQRLFQVKGASELNNSSSSTTSTTTTNSSGTNTSYPPHDRKIGCIPKF